MEDGDRIADALENGGFHGGNNEIKQEQSGHMSNWIKSESRSRSLSPIDAKKNSASPAIPETIPAPKLSRKSSQKVATRLAPTFAEYPDKTEESCRDFEVIQDCLYGAKHMGSSEHDALDCDCAEEWQDGENNACGEDSDCINRATKMECVDGDCNCGAGCQNQRFQRKQFADVSVIKTEKKGFGLRTNKALAPNDFIFEYIGEVINEPTFRRRMVQYDQEGIKHFYFMSLTKHEFVDATKKGNLGRFCNHSCNPNCYVDKWVVGDKLRMGIFAAEYVKAGEELVFNYNVDRYGADPQPCYCGETNCTGFIGGKTQTERATKLPLATIEALGIEDGDSWDTTVATVAKKPRKKKATEDDEEYVNGMQLNGLTEDAVTKVMAALMQCKEKWIAVKLLRRIQDAQDERVLHRVVRMHGYQILKTTLNTFVEDSNVVLQVLDVLYKFPRVTKNKISDSKIETAVEGLVTSEHEDIAAESKRLLDAWSKLETAYRIPRKKNDGTLQHINSFSDRRAGGSGRVDEPVPVKSATPLPDVVIPKGPRSNIPQRNANFYAPRGPRRPPPPPNNGSLPAGWFSAVDTQGRTYYYTSNQTVTWVRPTIPAITRQINNTPVAPKGPSKAQKEKDAVQEIIDSLTRTTPKVASASQTPRAASTPTQEPKKEKWRSLPVEKQMKLYENTLFAPVKSVMDKYRHKLPKADLKKFAKDVNKKLVASDYKNNRVEDPTRISAKQEKKVKAYVKDFFDRAVAKFQAHEKKKKERAEEQSAVNGSEASASTVQAGDAAVDENAVTIDEDVVMTDAESSPPASSPKKRKREDDEEQSPTISPEETPSLKRLKEDDMEAPTPPPPPPPPPGVDDMPDDSMMMEERELAADAQRREEEEALQRENEEAMLEFEKEKNGDKAQDGPKVQEHSVIGKDTHINGTGTETKVNGGAS